MTDVTPGFDGESVAEMVAPPPESEDGPPLEALEAGMAGEVKERDAATPAAARRAARAKAEDEDARSEATLPEVDDLVAKLPAELREMMDELLRVRFVRVKKVPRKDLAAPEPVTQADGVSPSGETAGRITDPLGGEMDI